MIVVRKKKLEKIEGGLKDSQSKEVSAPGFHSTSSSVSSFQKLFTSLSEAFLDHRDLDGTPKLFKNLMKNKKLLRQIMRVALYKKVPIPYPENTLMLEDKYVPLLSDGIGGKCIVCFKYTDPSTYYTIDKNKISEEEIREKMLGYFTGNNELEKDIYKKLSKL